MDFLNFLWNSLAILFSIFFHMMVFLLILDRIAALFKKKGGESDLRELLVVFVPILTAAGLSVYINVQNPQMKDIFYAKLFTYPALELKFDFLDEVSNEEGLQLVRALVKAFPNSEFKSAARTFRTNKYSDSSEGVRSSAKYIPNYWKIKDNSFYFYLGRPLSQEKIDTIEKKLALRFSKKKPLIDNQVSLKRRDEDQEPPIQFYFAQMNKGILPDEAEQLTHTITLQSFDIRRTAIPKEPMFASIDIISSCIVRFAIDDLYWTKKIQAFQQFLKTNKVARRAFSIDKTKSDSEIHAIASRFILRLRYTVTFSNQLTYPAKVFIDPKGDANLVITLKTGLKSSGHTDKYCRDLAYKVFPSLVPMYVKNTLLPDLPDALAIQKATIHRVRFSPFYSTATPVNKVE